MKAGKSPSSRAAGAVTRDPRLLVGRARIDAAAIDPRRARGSEGRPVTFASTIGRYAVRVNANDVACLREAAGSSRRLLPQDATLSQ
jgi:hypothetical protein